MFLITVAAFPPVEKKPSGFIHGAGSWPGITVMHGLLPLPNCIYTREREYANCNHQKQHFKEVTHEKDYKRDPV